MVVNSCLEEQEGRTRLKSMEGGCAGGEKRGINEWRSAVILDFGSFTRKGLLVDRTRPADTWVDKERRGQRVQVHK